MSLEFIESFDHFTNNANLIRKWTGPTSSAVGGFNQTTGRFGGKSFEIGWAGDYWSNQLPANATKVVGFALRTAASWSTTALCGFRDSGTAQVELNIDNTGHLYMTRNGTAVGSAAATGLATNTWYYVEWKVTIGASAAYEVRVDGTTVITGTGNTQNAGSTINEFRVGVTATTGSGWFQLDDLYIVNTSGTLNNNFLGECQVFMNLPTADGSATQWTPSTGSTHWPNVDDSNPDDDSTYNSSGVVGQIDLQTVPSITPTGAILGVQTVLTARKDDVATRQIADQCKSGSTTNTGSTQTMASAYGMFRQIRETDPNTGVQWTSGALNAAEWGVKVIT